MRIFISQSPVFCILPTLAFTDCQGPEECGDHHCTGGWALFLSWAGFDLGIAYSRPKKP